MADFFQILQREEQTKKGEKNDSPAFINDEKIESEPGIEKQVLEIKEKLEEKPNLKPEKKAPKKEQKAEENNILSKDTGNPIWLNIGEASKIGGIQTKTVRRAIKAPGSVIKYKIRLNRYLIDLRSLILFLHSNRKLKNKLDQNGIGQYIKEWRK